MTNKEHERLIADLKLVTEYILNLINQQRPMLTADIYEAAITLQRYAKSIEEEK